MHYKKSFYCLNLQKILKGGFLNSSPGFSMLEVMISIVVIAATILGSLKLQAEAMQSTQSTKSDLIATQLAQELMDNISLSGKPNNDWDLIYGAGASPTNTYLNAWLNDLKNTISNSDAQISCNNNSVCTIEIKWTLRTGFSRVAKYVVRNG